MNPLKWNFGKRRQWFEIQDFPWCPASVRDGVTDLLVLNLRLVPLYTPTLPWLKQMARMTDGNWVDLCAGAGGGSLLLKQKLGNEINELILTDLYPHQGLKLPSGVTLFPDSVDARSVPDELHGFRTLFTSFHHLPDEVAFRVLEDAFKKRIPIGVFEFTDRNLYTILMTLPSYFFSFLLVPFIRPWKTSRFFWTYIIPLIPLVTVVDVVLSCLRTRTPEELEKLTNPLMGQHYEWSMGKIPTAFGFSITYLTGMPKP